ncbi:hypothetical protein IMZ48_04185, partial [Candidatus Bathyarchaeota archaeon]|nr:hypothetical protein [Candidatus Bathyarchaeota archaeon]
VPPSTAPAALPAALDCIVVGRQPALLELSDHDDDLVTVQPRAYQRHFVALLDEPDEEQELEGHDDGARIPGQFEGGMDREIEEQGLREVALERYERGLFDA